MESKLYFGDCLEKLKELEKKSIDLVICDLPYGLTKNEWDKPINLELLWKELKRIGKPDTPFLMFGQGSFFIDLVCSNRKWYRYDLIWNKNLTTGFLNANRQPLRCHENIAVFFKKQPYYDPQFHKGPPLHSRREPKENKQTTYGDFKLLPPDTERTDKFPSSILTYAKSHPSNALHNTEKPVDLLSFLIRSYSEKGDMVLDCCMGSGQTGIACMETERNFIGMEIDKKFYDMAYKRIKAKEKMLNFKRRRENDDKND